MHDRILVPVDGSRFSEEVLPYALGIARAGGARLSLLRVVGREDERADARRDLDALAAELGAQASVVVGAGDTADVILGEAGREPGTLVAMTSHGRSGLMEAIMGSVAMRIVRASRDPVLLYRPSGASATGRRDPVSIKGVLLPLDGTPASEAMAPQAAAMAKWLGAELEVVQVISADTQRQSDVPTSDVRESSYVRQRAEEYAGRHGVGVSWEVLHGDAVEAITRHVGDRRDVVLAMATRGRKPLEAAIMGSVTAGCLQESGVPVLTRMP